MLKKIYFVFLVWVILVGNELRGSGIVGSLRIVVLKSKL